MLQRALARVHAIDHRQGDGKNHRPDGSVVSLDELEDHVFKTFGLVFWLGFVHTSGPVFALVPGHIASIRHIGRLC